MSSRAAMEEVRNRYGLRCGYCGVHEYEVGARLEVDHYCIASQVCQQKDTGSLQRPVAHTGSYMMEATLLFSPFLVLVRCAFSSICRALAASPIVTK